ncbi:SDR family oxidoreductase [Tenggerimyces flavus]|uniref:SDR family oxidoreductase n=1 Tax=Tenggerimyces flavus TaxID=1708749 RepID=A0ABV7YNI0_9ACTN
MAAALPATLAAAATGGSKVVLITGTSSGFGLLTALTLARAGHRVFASMRNTRSANAGVAKEFRATARQASLALEVLDIDIRDDRSVEAGVRRVADRAGRIDVLVKNAGIFSPAVMETLSVDDLRDFFDTNVFGHVRMNRAVLPLMRRQSDGLVVQVTTALGRLVLPFMGAYVASKWAMEAITETSRYELSRFGVDVVIVEPGEYQTDLVDPNGVANYRRYLRRLTPDNARRRREYGDLARMAETHLLERPGPPDPPPQQVADAIADLVRTPRGQRPIRLWGPGNLPGWAALNDTAARIQRDSSTPPASATSPPSNERPPSRRGRSDEGRPLLSRPRLKGSDDGRQGGGVPVGGGSGGHDHTNSYPDRLPDRVSAHAAFDKLPLPLSPQGTWRLLPAGRVWKPVRCRKAKADPPYPAAHARLLS